MSVVKLKRRYITRCVPCHPVEGKKELNYYLILIKLFNKISIVRYERLKVRLKVSQATQ